MFKLLLIVTFWVVMPLTNADDHHHPFSIIPLTNAADHRHPFSIMQDIAKNIFSRIKNIHDPNYLRIIVHQELMPFIQVKYAGALALGAYYKEATPEQRKIYFDAFQSYLEQAYSQALTIYHGQNYQISPDRSVNNANIIVTRISIIDKVGRPPIRLDFQWRKNTKSGDWQIYDMITEGVSMIITKQNEWAVILRTQGIDALIKKLQAAATQTIILDKKNYVDSTHL